MSPRNTSRFMIILSIVCLTIALAPSNLFATDPYPIPPSRMPPAITPSGPANLFVERPILPDPGGLLTLPTLQRAGLSNSDYNAFHRALTASPVLRTSAVDTSVLSRSKRLHISADAFVADGFKATNDTLQDAESAVVAQLVNGSPHTVTASNHYANVNGVVYNHINAESSATFTPGSFTPPAQLPIPVDRRGSPQFADSTDPILAGNPQTGG